jgi:hypothetical protein
MDARVDSVQPMISSRSFAKTTRKTYDAPHFVEKAARAGVRQVFVGLENINPDNLIAAKKRQNRIMTYAAVANASAG